jgi:hypothetical protein
MAERSRSRERVLQQSAAVAQSSLPSKYYNSSQNPQSHGHRSISHSPQPRERRHSLNIQQLAQHDIDKVRSTSRSRMESEKEKRQSQTFFTDKTVIRYEILLFSKFVDR